ncbi:MAG: hypothetical protein K1X89_03815 [Myxococcaceae bacterium]|nr:hypothetical protein [Myxococcaceae bacterium]
MKLLNLKVVPAVLAVSLSAWAEAVPGAAVEPATTGAVVAQAVPSTDDVPPLDWSHRRLSRKVSAQLGVGASAFEPLMMTTPMLAIDFGWVELSAGALLMTPLRGTGSTLAMPRVQFSALQNLGFTLTEHGGFASSLLFGRAGLMFAGWPNSLVDFGGTIDPVGLRLSWVHGPDVTLRGRVEAAFVVLTQPVNGWGLGAYIAPGISLEVALPL